MARENQGLQIALIIFVMLTIVLAVTTFLFFRRYDEALRASHDATERENKAKSDLANKDAECGNLKRLIGMAGKATPEIETESKADMQKYGADNYPEDARFYSPMLARVWEVVEDKSNQVKVLEGKLKDQETRWEGREAARKKQIEEMSAVVKSSGAEVEKVTNDFKEQRAHIIDDQTKLAATVEKARIAAKAVVDKAEENLKKRQADLEQITRINKENAEKIQKMNRPDMDVPAGEVRWVNQHAGTVWINLGRADSLERQITFSVYSGDAMDLGKAQRKASIEVTKILGDHVAEAKVLEDKIADPIMPGDKLHSPMWSPGQQNHFALAGIMNIDGDGRDAMQTVRSLITMNGGVVDCELDSKGKRNGDLTAQTRFLVLGDEPKADALQGFTSLQKEAEKLGIRKMTLTELKQKMGYKKQTTVERFGTGAGPSDVRPAKAADSTPKKSSGAASAAPKKARPEPKAKENVAPE